MYHVVTVFSNIFTFLPLPFEIRIIRFACLGGPIYVAQRSDLVSDFLSGLGNITEVFTA